MITLQISLPEDLARDAKEMGLLKPDTISEILRNEIRKQACNHLLSIADELAATGDKPMTAEEVQEEIRAVRREQHATRS
ncbi:hypothetical protein [Duganella callida]|uniref:CopG family transcriptional regulator n=1 Tax=Duganella callida TaxID=2561932 RepID=A0A4Y9SJ10_9BURK|nr:hypothetical protein [Duganella callida]TFW22269.1 hypothetical protein E4L98_12315 [Duganella callida]